MHQLVQVVVVERLAQHDQKVPARQLGFKVMAPERSHQDNRGRRVHGVKRIGKRQARLGGLVIRKNDRNPFQRRQGRKRLLRRTLGDLMAVLPQVPR